MFNLSLSLERVPALWKTSCVVPVPKISHPKELNHYRPIVLTSHLMKAMERIVLSYLRNQAPGNTVRVMFFDFSSAFNTIQSSLLRGKLEVAGMDQHLAAWIIDYLTDRPQFVRLPDFKYNSHHCHLQKFSDDTAIVGCVSGENEQEYTGVIADFVDWCDSSHPLHHTF
ncbi:RNA-directed DNA polymerase from mobile element jockey [Labeo rohita]|uniref:RNA-directed DNA polymerase from mobile element jockey n=1 Tax=Labeo rohita TaxID=84645 RepID=A0ABQ8L8A0_LABRO|nr:RNA-directed DNA polymerase from mobile element jockey [Labeo rohita]